MYRHIANTPQPLYSTIVGVHDNFRVSYPICVITRVKCIDIIANIVELGSNNDPCNIRNHVPTNVIKRSRCTS